MTTAAIVLAGGASARFGADKLAALHRGRPVLHHALEAAASVGDTVILVVGPDAAAPALPDTLRPSVRIARDREAHQGPLAGLASGLAAVPAGVDRAIVVAGDMPALVPAVLQLLLDALGGPERIQAVRLEADPPSPLPLAVVPVILRTAERQLAGGRRSLRALLDEVATATLPAASWRALDPDGRTLRDIDTPGDLAGG